MPKLYFPRDAQGRILKGGLGLFKGRKHTEETKRKISVSALSRDKGAFIKSEEHKRKISQGRKKWLDANPWWKHFLSEKYKGSGGSNWQGGKTAATLLDRKGLKYTQWRQSVFERDNFTCQICKKRGGKLNADHIKMYSTHPGLRYEINNGRTLCVDCHRKTPTWGGLTRFKKKVYA